MATLRRFLYKNQNQRFTDKATARIFDTIQIYATDKGLPTDDREGLLEDALKMPFTVFSTKQKKTMLKWIEEIRGTNDSTDKISSSSQPTTTVLTVMDIDDDTIHLMTPEGDETFEVALSALASPLKERLQAAFAGTDESLEIDVVRRDDGSETVVSIVGLHTEDAYIDK